MSIDWLFELERAIDAGKEIFACPGLKQGEWVITRTAADLKKTAQRVVDQRKMAVHIVRMLNCHDAVAGDTFLVPVKIDQPGPRNEPHITWSNVETKEAAEMLRDVRHGPSPFFAIQVQETIEPPKV